MHWFYWNDFDIHGVDMDEERLAVCKELYPEIKDHIVLGKVEELPYTDESFDHIISSAVLHFAKDHDHFYEMLAEMVRVLKVGGTLWIRMTTDLGVKDQKEMNGGVYYLQDDTYRYLLTKSAYLDVLSKHNLTPLEPFKSVVVDEVRSMGVIVLQKGQKTSIL